MFVMNDELDEDQAMIMSGAGGDGQRLRYYFVLSTENKQLFNADQRKTVSEALDNVSEKLESKIENLEFQDYSVLVIAMIPIDVAVGTLIEDTINTCNKTQPFIRFHYYVINTNKPSQKDIQTYLNELD